MRHFAWISEHEVFIAQIDAEHRDLIEAADAFERALEEKLPDSRERLQALAARLEDHLCHEEWLMQSVRYPLFGWHRQQHQTARRRVKLFLPLVEEGNANATEAFLEFLAGWFADHVGVADRMMAAFVRNYERAHAAGALERWGLPACRSVPSDSQDGANEASAPLSAQLNRH